MKATASMIMVLVEDDLGHAELVRRNLKRAGIAYEILHVTDGQQALDFVRREGRFAAWSANVPFLMLLDINLPRVDGIEVLRQIKSQPAWQKVPVIMLTTEDDPDEVSRCYELGCSVYVTKPVEYGAFVQAVKRLGLFPPVTVVPVQDTPS